jgi:uncharacterized coiled-coil protein SlyX
MKPTKLTLAICLLSVLGLPVIQAQSGNNDEVEQLKVRLAAQQKEIDLLQKALTDQQRTLDRLAAANADTVAAVKAAPAPATGAAAAPAPLPHVGGLVASTSGTLPSTASASVGAPATSPAYYPPAQAGNANASSPLQVLIGNVSIIPVGFMDLTAVWRDKDAGSSIGSNFGGVPYNNATTGKLSEFRFSPQNSRIGFRVDGDWKGAHFIGYNEFDFLGTSGSNALGVTNGAFVPRIRLYWVDVRKGKVEFLAGQSWSMLTPNRKGISPLPGDLFYSQVMDVNYLAGLTWTRQPGLRVVFHPTDRVAIGFAAENPNQYMGGSAGGSSIVLPSALTGLAGTEIDNTGTTYLSTPNVAPDFMVKVAADPASRVHVEVAGLESTFKLWNTTTGTPTSGDYFTKAGVGGSVNANLEVAKNFRLITNNYWSDGGGRYIFGQAPDFMVRSDGSISPVHAGGLNEGFEANATKNLALWGYYGGIYIGRNVAVDANGTSLVGYGYRGSANSQNRAIQEFTIGFTNTFWKDPRYGALSLIGQYEYLTRDPWYVAPGAPKATHDNTMYVDVRYTLPGAAPASK